MTVLSATAIAGTAGTAAADVTDNNTPATARTFSTLPFEDTSATRVDYPAATDPAGRKVAAACNGGSDVYGTAWWKYTPSSRSTFVVHSALVTGPTPDQPTGLAVVSGDLGSVLKCGAVNSNISDAGAFTVDAGQSLYIVTFYSMPTDLTIFSPTIGVYPSTGQVPANDDYTAATKITSLPFTATQDTTLATIQPSEPVCYDRDGTAASVWYSVTVPTTRTLDVVTQTDYNSNLVIASSVDDQSTWQCSSGADQFQAQAGVTYLIGVAGTSILRNSGQLTISVSAAPSAPQLQLKIASTGKVNKRTGVVHLNGTVTCSGTDTTNPVSGTITQVYQRVIHTQSFTGTTAACTGAAAKWTAVIKPTTFKWTTGQATIAASVTACNNGGCTTVDAKRKIKLENTR